MIVDLNSKTAIITGAAGGIGKAVTDAVFDAGARVFAVDQSEKIRENELEEKEHILAISLT